MAMIRDNIPHLLKHGIARIASIPAVSIHMLSQLKAYPLKFTRINCSAIHTLKSQHYSLVQNLCFRMDFKLFQIYTGQKFSNQVTSPYKVTRDFTRDTLVYSYENKKMYRYLTIFGVIQFILWVNMSSFFYEFFHAADLKDVEREKEKHWWEKLMGLQTKYKYSSSIFCMLIASVALFVSWIYPLRTVQKLTLLTGGQNLRVTTYYHFGMTRDVNIPLENISFSTSRQFRKESTLSSKIKGKWFYFMLDTRSGKFHDPELFDHVVGLERKL